MTDGPLAVIFEGFRPGVEAGFDARAIDALVRERAVSRAS